MASKITIDDIARMAGVSKRTVSRVINDSPLVGAASREKVRQIIEESGYRPSPQARGLASNRSFLIGMIYDNPDASFTEAVVRGISEVCLDRGYELVVHPCKIDEEGLIENAVDFASRTKVDGIIIPPPISELDELVDAFDELSVPTVRLRAKMAGPPERTVASDECAGARHVTSYLLNRGHRAVAYIAGPDGLLSTEERLKGFRQALMDRELEVRDEFIVSGDYSFGSGIACAEALLRLPERPTAIFASNDEMAIGVMHAARAAGLEIPGDLSVVGFDDNAAAKLVLPPLTTVSRPVRRMASEATKKLIARIDGRDDDAKLECQLSPELILRGSAASPAE